MYESLKNKITEMLKAKTPEMDGMVEDMQVSFMPPDGMKGMVNYKLGEKMCKSMFSVTDNEIELDPEMEPEADDTAINTDSTLDTEMTSDVVNNESMDSSNTAEEETNVKGEEPTTEVDNAKTENVEAEPTEVTPEVEATPEANTTEPETETVVENSKISAEATFDDLVDQYGYMTALKIQDGTITI